MKPYLGTCALGMRERLCCFDRRTLERLLDRLQRLALKTAAEDLRAAFFLYEILDVLTRSHRRSWNVPVFSRLPDDMCANLEKPLSVREQVWRRAYRHAAIF